MNSYRGIKVIAFAVLSVVCLAVPISQAVKYCWIQKHGEVVKFRMEGFDPRDIFRGKYVTVRLSPRKYIPGKDNAAESEQISSQEYQTVYAVLGKDDKGFATIESLSVRRPEHGTYWKVRAIRAKDKISLIYPLDRFYMNEHLAGDAESLIWKDIQNTAAVVRLKDGTGMLDDVEINGVPLARLAREMAGKK